MRRERSERAAADVIAGPLDRLELAEFDSLFGLEFISADARSIDDIHHLPENLETLEALEKVLNGGVFLFFRRVTGFLLGFCIEKGNRR